MTPHYLRLAFILAGPGALASAQGHKISGPLAPEVIGDVYRVQISPDGTRIVYSATQVTTNGDLFSISTAGGPSVRLTPEVPTNYGQHPFKNAITPDSTRVLYLRSGLFSVPIDGGPEVQLNRIEHWPVNSFLVAPDATRVVYKDQDSGFSLHSTVVDGGTVTELAPSASEYSITSDSSRVVYNRQESPRFLYSVPILGGVPTRLDDSATGVPTFRLSDDGTWAVYETEDLAGTNELYSVPVSGGPPIRLNGPLVAGGSVRGQNWEVSADSTRVVYVADQDTDEVREVYSVPIGGGASTKLNGTLTPGGGVVAFHLSPDANHVVYQADQDTNEVFELYGVPIGGGAAVKVSQALPTGRRIVSVQISPDSTKVLYNRTGAPQPRIYCAPITGGTNVLLARADDDYRILSYAVHPDSSYVVYQSQHDSSLNTQLHGVSIAGGESVQLDSPTMSGNYVENDIFSYHLVPDMDLLVYPASQDLEGVSELFSVPLEGGQTQKLNPMLANEGIAGDVTDFELSADGATAVFRADKECDETFELYGVHVIEGTPERLSGSMVRGGDVSTFALTRDGRAVIYIADQEVDERHELYGRFLDSPSGVKISGDLVEGGNVTHAVLSPSDTWVVYRADQDIDGVFELFATDGGPAHRIHEPLALTRRVEEFKLSQEDFVVYRFWDGPSNVTELRSAPLTGGPSTLLSLPLSFGREVGSIFWVSADGGSVVYTADAETANEFELYRVSVNGGKSTKLNGPLGTGVLSGFKIRPDGLAVVYETNDAGVRDLHHVPILGGAPVGIAGPFPPFRDVDFLFAPDSTRIVYRVGVDSSAREIYSVLAEGGPATKLNVPVTTGITHYEISPDSAHVIYRQFPGSVMSVPLAGGPSTLLSPATGWLGEASISPDSNTVLYSHASHSTLPPYLFQVPILGGVSRRVGGERSPLGPAAIARGMAFFLGQDDATPPDQPVELYLGFLTRPHRRAR